MVDFTLSKLTVLMRPTLVQNYIMYWEVKIYTCIFILISSFLHFIRFRISQKHFFTDFVHPFLQGKRTKIIIHTCIQGVIQCTYAIWFQIKLSAEQNNNHKTTKTTKYSCTATTAKFKFHMNKRVNDKDPWPCLYMFSLKRNKVTLNSAWQPLWIIHQRVKLSKIIKVKALWWGLIQAVSAVETIHVFRNKILFKL